MNYDLLGELVGPWVQTRVLPTSLEADLVLSEGLDLTPDLILDPPSKTPERRRSCSKSPSRSPVRCPSIRSCTRSGSASYTRSRSQSPSYSQTPSQHEPYIPIWKRQIARFPEYQRHFLRNVVSRLRGMPNLDKFFEVCGIP